MANRSAFPSLSRNLRTDVVWAVLAFGGLALVGSWWVGPGRGLFSSLNRCLVTVLVFFVSHLAATFFHYFPRGVENGLLRLSLAAFCRTFLPLLALVVVHQYIFPLLEEASLLGVAASYLVSLGLTFASALRGSAGS